MKLESNFKSRQCGDQAKVQPFILTLSELHVCHYILTIMNKSLLNLKYAYLLSQVYG